MSAAQGGAPAPLWQALPVVQQLATQIRRVRSVANPAGVRRVALVRTNTRPLHREPVTLAPPAAPGPDRPRLVHIAHFGTNAGDLVLPPVVRDVVAGGVAGGVSWRARHVHRAVDERMLRLIDGSRGVVIGGGGLFLPDTNANDLSGWQWSCSVDALRRIRVPLALFGVGYNLFRGQGGFGPVFAEHLRLLAEKATWIGLRNTGSIEGLAAHLPADLHPVLRYQPCPTTVTGLLYDLARPPALASGPPVVALNCAFDRRQHRYGDRADAVLDTIARAMATVADDAVVTYVAHDPSDEEMLGPLARHGLEPEVVRLYAMAPDEALRAYLRPTVVVGMRGHAQLMPFGVGRPTVSLVSHDKLWYFLDDVGHREWGVDVADPDLGDRLVAAVGGVLDDVRTAERAVEEARLRLWAVTQANVDDLVRAWGLEGGR